MNAPNLQVFARQKAFTLMELLVVVAVIGVLASLLLPSLAHSKSQAQGAYCQNNTRQLVVGCIMYCDDNYGYFPYNLVASNADTNINWAGGVLDWEATPDNTNTAYLTGGALGPYLHGSSEAFRCPSDTVLSGLQRGLGWANRDRTYSMNASIGDAGAVTQSGVNSNNPYFVQFFKYSSVPQPAQIFVFMEEHPDTISDGYFLNKVHIPEWLRLPASYHNASANVSFADGHAELHKWLDSWTTPPSVPDGAEPSVNTNLPANQMDDFNWVVSHMTVKGH